MRHFFVARPVATLSHGMVASPRRTSLIAPPGALDRATPSLLGAVRSTINLATVAPAADKGLTMTLGAAEETGRDSRLRPLQRDKT